MYYVSGGNLWSDHPRWMLMSGVRPKIFFSCMNQDSEFRWDYQGTLFYLTCYAAGLLLVFELLLSFRGVRPSTISQMLINLAHRTHRHMTSYKIFQETELASSGGPVILQIVTNVDLESEKRHIQCVYDWIAFNSRFR